MAAADKPIILHLGDGIKFNHDLYNSLASQFTINQPTLSERVRPAFLSALRSNKWGSFSAIMRPHWSTGGEMGPWDAELISLLPKSVKIFASAGAGYDWADVSLLATHSILYCNGASASSEAVSDMALYHILSVFRNLQWSNLAARSGSAEEFLDAHHNAPYTARNPAGHVLGVVGLGNIGHVIAKKAYLGLGMRIVYFDVKDKREHEEGIKARRCKSLEEMLGMADCVVLAAPGQGNTRLINAETLKMFKKGGRLVNIARGSLVDEEAMADALESGQLVAVGLDVHADEPNVSERLVGNRNATLTCHTAGGALETNVGFERLAMENVRRVLNGEEALTPVNGHLMKR